MAVPSVASSLLLAVRASFFASFGDSDFGMEDGTVSIFGLVFGVAASATDSRVVLLAGAAAAAIAMMAGTYLDADSTRGQAKARIASAKQAIERNRPSELEKVRERLRGAGLDDRESNTDIDVLDRHPALLRQPWRPPSSYRSPAMTGGTRSFSLSGCSSQTSWQHSSPSSPLPSSRLSTARIVSISITAILLRLLGIARGIVARSSILRGALETLGIATAAAITGYFIGKIIITL